MLTPVPTPVPTGPVEATEVVVVVLPYGAELLGIAEVVVPTPVPTPVPRGLLEDVVVDVLLA